VATPVSRRRFLLLAGTTVGAMAAFYAGRADTVIMRSMGGLLAFPYLLLAIAVVTIPVTVLAFNLMGDGLRDALDPRPR
jgi:ABC-type dipeptide/oligopeptide/nickel transport system permease subunit